MPMPYLTDTVGGSGGAGGSTCSAGGGGSGSSGGFHLMAQADQPEVIRLLRSLSPADQATVMDEMRRRLMERFGFGP